MVQSAASSSAIWVTKKPPPPSYWALSTCADLASAHDVLNQGGSDLDSVHSVAPRIRAPALLDRELAVDDSMLREDFAEGRGRLVVVPFDLLPSSTTGLSACSRHATSANGSRWRLPKTFSRTIRSGKPILPRADVKPGATLAHRVVADEIVPPIELWQIIEPLGTNGVQRSGDAR
jgi:hypothetical protein